MLCVINHERYGEQTVFNSLEEAQATIRACGPEFAATELTKRLGDIVDERGDVVGSVLYLVGPWGYGDSTRGVGHWYASAANLDAAYDAYTAMGSDNLGPDCDSDIKAAGGIFVRD